ncbi:hypothetical protein DRO32_04225 [Candidatus Bathyarchaeota archaeon]|nr:MAG: hypothetical protein DRO32_04225 [Candidatus Bathyarchaeota archaeon]
MAFESGAGPGEKRIESAIRRLSALAGISMVMVVGPGGEELYRWYKTSADRFRIGLEVKDILELLDRTSSFLSKIGPGPLEDMIIRTKEKVAVIQAAGNAFLVTVAYRSANLALLLIRSRATAEELSKILG